MSARNSLSLSLRVGEKKVKRRWWCAPLAFIGVREWESLIRWHSGLLIQVTFFFFLMVGMVVVVAAVVVCFLVGGWM